MRIAVKVEALLATVVFVAEHTGLVETVEAVKVHKDCVGPVLTGMKIVVEEEQCWVWMVVQKVAKVANQVLAHIGLVAEHQWAERCRVRLPVQ